jgi:hypothetical protein
MRNAIVQLSLMLFLLLGTSSADSISYVATGVFGSSTPITNLTAPNTAFSFTFSQSVPVVPITSDGASFTTLVSVTYLSGINNLNIPNALVTFFDDSQQGLFDISFQLGNDYAWEFLGPQIFAGATSNPTLLTGTFFANPDSALFVNDGPPESFGSGQVVAAAAVPEPGTLLLVGTGLLSALGALRRRSSSS